MLGSGRRLCVLPARSVVGEGVCGYCDGGGYCFWVSDSLNRPTYAFDIRAK